MQYSPGNIYYCKLKNKKMRQFVIQDHIIDEIYDHIKNKSPEIPMYVKFAYVADKYAEARLNRRVEGSFEKGKFIDPILNINDIPLPIDQVLYNKYAECESIEGFIAFFKSKNSNFSLPKQTEKAFLARRKLISMSIELQSASEQDKHSKAVALCKFLIENHNVIKKMELENLKTSLDLIEQIKDKSNPQVLAEKLCKKEGFIELLVNIAKKIVNATVKVITFGKCNPFENSLIEVNIRRQFRDWLKSQNTQQKTEVNAL